MRALAVVDALAQDLRDAARHLRRNLRFALTVLSVLALGIGANVAVLTVLHALLLQPLPYAEPDRLVRLWESNPEQGLLRSPVSRGNFYDWRERARSFEYIEAFSGPGDRLVRFGSGDPEIVRQASGTDRFLEMLGVAPAIGTTDGIRLSRAFWQRRFGADSRAIGTRYIFEGFASQPLHVSGVMPEGFDFPAGADAWGTLSFGRARHARNVRVLARLKPGVSLEQARAEMDVLAAALAREHPAENSGWRVEMAPLRDTIVGDVRSTLWLLYGAVCLVLLIAISNAAGLVLARRIQLQRDTAVRLALGASVGRLRRRQGFECALLAAAAGLAGLAIAAAAIEIMLALAPPAIPRIHEIAITTQVAYATLVLTAAVGLLLWVLSFGARLSITGLIAGGRQAGSRWATTTRSAITVAQIAFCVALLLVSIVVVRSFVALQAAPIGFESGGVLSVQIRHVLMKPGETVKHYPTRRFARVTGEVVALARGLPGVESAASAWHAPLSRASGSQSDFMILDTPRTGPLTGAPPVAGPAVRRAELQIVTPAYFETLHIPLLNGRYFDAADRLTDTEIDDHDAPRGTGVAIISESLARREWPGRDPLGSYLAIPSASYRSVEVVGIVADVRSNPDAEPPPIIYLPYAQAPMNDVTLLVRSSGAPIALAGTIRERLRAYGSDISAFNVKTMDEIVARALARPRFTSAVMSWFGAAGVLIMAAGLYSLLSFMVVQRTRELAVRLAVGAAPRHVLAIVVGRGLRLAFIGIAAGLITARIGERLVRSALPDVQPVDLRSGVIAAAAILALACLASYVPARRATRIDPVAALRTE